MNVLYIYDGAWPKGATRVLKETRALAAAGHLVTLVSRNLENAPVRQTEPWMRIRRLPRIPGRGLRYALNFPLFVNPVWLWAIWRAIRESKTDLILVCDLPLALTAVWFGRVLGIPVHYDMAEIYPEFLRSLRQLERQGPLKRLVRTPAMAEWVERVVLKRVACTYVVSDESRDRCIRLGVDPDRVVLVGNTPEHLPDIGSPPIPPPEIEDLVRNGREVLLFVGIIIADRGVLDVVRAMPELLALRPEAFLVVVGDGPERPALEREVRSLGLESSVRFVGWKVPDELPDYYRVAMIGLLPFRDSPHIRLTLANKLFDYMGAGLPILASDLPSTRRVVEAVGAGRLHRPDDPADIARSAAGLLADLPGRTAMGAKARRAAETTFAWHRDAERLCEAIARLR